MISRIRVEARAASMEQAEREIEIVLQHMQMAGYLEGLVPQSSKEADQHFGRVFGEVDGWHELGLGYEGRKVLNFEPEVADGGLKLYGYSVQVNEKDQLDANNEVVPTGSFPSKHGDDVTDKVIVLERRVDVTREHSWDRVSGGPFGRGALIEAPPKEPSPENLARIIKLSEHEVVTEFGYSRRSPGWGVDISLYLAQPGGMGLGQNANYYGLTLAEALDQAEAMLADFLAPTANAVR